jgi:hypothetical protein
MTMKRQLEIQLSAELTINAKIKKLTVEESGISFYTGVDEELIEKIMSESHEWVNGIIEFHDGTVYMTVDHPKYEDVMGGFTNYWVNQAKKDPEGIVEEVIGLDNSHCTPSMKWQTIAAIAQAQIK